MAARNALRIVITGDSKDLDRTLTKVNKSLGGTGRAAYMANRGMGGFVQQMGGSQKAALATNAAIEKQKQSLQGLGRFARTAGLVLGGLTAAGLTYGMKLNAQWETNEKSFGTLLGSMRKGKKLMEDLRQVSSKSYLRLTDFQEASKLMLGMGVSANRIVPIMGSVNAAVSAIGGNRDTLNRVTMALGQMQAKGKASAEEMRQLAEAGLPINKILQKSLGLSAEQVANIGNEGVSAGKVLRAVSESWRKQYGPGLNESLKSGSAQFQLLQKNAEGFLRVATHGLYEELSKKVLPAANRELSKFTDIVNNDKLSGGQKVARLEQRFDQLIDKVGDLSKKALPKVGAAIDRFAPMFTRLVDKLVPLFADLFAKMIQVGAPVLAKGAGTLAKAFVTGFLKADFLGKMLVGSWLFSKLGGFAALNAAGMGVGTRIMGGVSKAMSAGMATSQVGSALGANSLTAATSGMAVAGRSLAMSLVGSLTKAIPIAAGVFAVTDILGRTVSDGPTAGLKRAGATAGGALVGGILGSIVAPGVGTAVGAGIGASLGGPIENALGKLFGRSEQVDEFARQVKWADQVLANSASKRQAISGRMASFQQLLQGANRQSRRATNNLKQAEDNLAAARSQHGANSSQAQRAELELAKAKERSNRATARANRLGQLSGPIREASKQSYRSALAVQKQAVSTTQEEVRQAKRAFFAAKNRGAGNAELTRKSTAWLEAEKKLGGQQKATASLLRSLSRDLGPKAAAAMNRQADAALKSLKWNEALRKSFGKLPTPIGQVEKSVGNLSQKVPGKLRMTKEAAARFGDTTSQKMRKASTATTGSVVPMIGAFTTISASAKQRASEIKNLGPAEAKRKGGLINRFRSGGLVPVRVSPGEEIHHRGRVAVVPGRPEPRDSVLTQAPVGASVVTFDGQRRMASGASLGQAVRDQKPHFGAGAPAFREGGGIPNPQLSGGTPRTLGMGRTGVRLLRGMAVSKLKKLRELAAASVAGNGINGLVPQVKRALAFAKANGWGGSVTSGFRTYAEQARLYQMWLNGTGNLAAPPGSSNHEGGEAVDVTDTEGFAAAMARMGKGRLLRLIPGEPWHFSVTGHRRGGLVQSLGGGGKVTPSSMRRKARNRTKAPWLRNMGKVTKDQAYTLAAYAGIPNPKWASQVVFGESSYNLRTVGNDPGGTKGYGLWQITSGFNDHIINRYGGPSAMFDPVTNARAARDVYLERRKMGVSGESGWYGKLGPAGKFDPDFYQRILWAPGQFDHARKASRKRRRSVGGLWSRIRKSNARGFRAGGRVPAAVKKLAGLSRKNASKAQFWAGKDPAKSLFFRRKSARQQQNAGRRLSAWSKKRRRELAAGGGKPGKPGAGNSGSGQSGSGGGKRGGLFAGLPAPIRSMLGQKYLTGDQKRSVLDMYLGQAEATEGVADDRAALTAIVGFETGRRDRAQGLFGRTSRTIAGMRFGKGSGKLSGKSVNAGTVRAAKKRIRLADKALGKIKPGKSGKLTAAQKKRRKKLLAEKRGLQRTVNQFERVTGKQESALSQITSSDSSILDANRSLKDLDGAGGGGSDLAEELKLLREEIAKQTAAMKQGFDADARTMRNLLTDALSGQLAGRAGPVRGLGFQPAVNF